MRRRLGAIAVLLAVVGCTDGQDASPAPTTRLDASTTTVDLTGVVLGRVPGETTTTGPAEAGRARLVGTVRGPDGPVAGATVRVERLVGSGAVRRDLLTGPDGRWALDGVPGGRYRVRAFLAPTLAQTSADVRFLADGDEHSFDLVVEDQGGIVVRADIAPDQPAVGADVNLVVLVAVRTVDVDGVVRAVPVTDRLVELHGFGRWVLRGGPDDEPSSNGSQRLDGSGQARFELRCLSAGDPGLVLRLPVATEAGTSTESVALEIAGCGGQPASTTTTSRP